MKNMTEPWLKIRCTLQRTCETSLKLYPLDHAAAVRAAPSTPYAYPCLQGSVRTSRKVDVHVCGELYMFAFLVQVSCVGIYYTRTSTSTQQRY